MNYKNMLSKILVVSALSSIVALNSFAGNERHNGEWSRGKKAGVGIGAGAATGAVVGTMVAPGIGTAAGATVGAVTGGLIGTARGGKHRCHTNRCRRRHGEETNVKCYTNRCREKYGQPTVKCHTDRCRRKYNEIATHANGEVTIKPASKCHKCHCHGCDRVHHKCHTKSCERRNERRANYCAKCVNPNKGQTYHHNQCRQNRCHHRNPANCSNHEHKNMAK